MALPLADNFHWAGPWHSTTSLDRLTIAEACGRLTLRRRRPHRKVETTFQSACRKAFASCTNA